MLPTKIVVVGAASASFGLNTLASLIRSDCLRGSHLVLVDPLEANLITMGLFAERLNQVWGAGFSISTNTSITDNQFAHHKPHPLEDAEFVILSIEIPPREALWRTDFEIPLKYGVRQPYAENGGPGGFAHAARNLTVVMQIIQEMEKYCPNALLVNFTNPMMRICDAVSRYSRIQVVGLCHQIRIGYAMVGKALASDFSLEVPPGFTSTKASPLLSEIKAQVARQAMDKFDILAAGLNHFTWMLNIRKKSTGEDLYPLFTRRWHDLEQGFEPLTRCVFDTFGVFPIPGDEHLSEYLPWMSDNHTEPWKIFNLSLYEWSLWEQEREKTITSIQQYIEGELDIDSLRDVQSEGAVEIIEDVSSGSNRYHAAVNLPNRGYITNLPENAIVELPGVASSNKIRGKVIGELPESIAELCHREITVTHLCVDAVIRGDRKLALQCLLLDPVITDMQIAQKILDEYLISYRDYLPNFWLKGHS
jgi:alpha-galactosidase